MNIFCKYGTFVHELATMAQEVERRLGKAEVTGSNPLVAYIDFTERVSFGRPFFLIY